MILTRIIRLFLLSTLAVILYLHAALAQAVISYGQTLSGSISVAAEKDEVTFSGTIGDKVTIRFSKTSGTISLYGELFNPSGTRIGYSSSGEINAALAVSGTFKITLRDYSNINTGDYSLTIQRVNNPAGAVALTFGQTVTGSIDSFTKIISYSFSATASDTITIRSAKATTVSGTFSPYLELYDSTGTRIAYSAINSLTKKVTVTGNYYLLITDQTRDGTGTYSLSIQKVNNPVGAAALTFGQTTSGNIDSFAKIESYSFSATANDTITIRSSTITTASGTFSPYLELYDSTGTRIAYSAINSLTKKVTVTGNYYLLITDQTRDGTGTYSLSIQKVNNPVGAAALTFGQTTSGNIDSLAKIETYNFSATANDTITIRSAAITTTSGTFSPYLELYDSTGTRIAYSAINALTSKVTLTGNYCLLVTDNSRDGTGTYSLSIQRVNNPGGSTALTFGQTVSGSIDSFAKIATCNFSATANDTITIRSATITTASGTFSPYLELYDSTGTRIAYSAINALTSKVTLTGNYCLLVTDNSRDGTGTFELSIQRANNPADTSDLSYDTVIEGTINYVTQFKAYKITAQANDKITFCSAVKQGTINFNVYAELYDTSGVRLTYGPAGSFKYTFLVSGTFYLFISDNASNGTGTYKFSLVKSDIACSSIDLIDPEVTLNNPKPGEIVENNSVYNITWTSTDNFGVTGQEIRFSEDSGITFSTVIATALTGSVQSYSWSIPANLSSIRACIKIIARDAKGNEGYNANIGDFIIISTALPLDAANLNYQYDNQNRLIQSTDGAANTTYTYDQADNRTNLNAN